VHVPGGEDGARSHRRNWFLFDANLLAVGCLGRLLWIGFNSSGRLTPSCINNTPSRTRLKSLSRRAFVLTMVKNCWILYNQMQLAIVCISA
jgi:hypothetical protein